MAFIDSTVVNVALPALQENLHATIVGVQWVVESYGLFLAALILVGGSLGDLFGRRRIFLVGVGIFAAASVTCGLSLNLQQLVIARCIQGVGAAFLVPGSLSIISACFDEQTRGQAIGTWSGFTAITAAVGPILGGWLIEHAVALGILHQCSTRGVSDRNFDTAHSRKPQRQCRACRLAGSAVRDCRIRRGGLRVR
jgi:MFS family permease